MISFLTQPRAAREAVYKNCFTLVLLCQEMPIYGHIQPNVVFSPHIWGTALEKKLSLSIPDTVREE